MDAKNFFDLLRETYDSWNADKAPRLGAALSYYTVFSLSPMLVVAIGVASLFTDSEAARTELFKQLSGTVGKDAAGLIAKLLQSSSAGGQGKSIAATLIGFATILLGAGGLFGQLQDSLNTIWGVQPKPNQGFGFMLRERFVSFAMVLGIGFLLLVSLALSAAVAALSRWMQSSFLPGPPWVFELLNVAISFGIITLLFAAMFKVLPDVEIRWRDVWIGAAVTSFLFTLGKFALGFYLGRQSVESTYGAAGALVLLLLWVYYAAQILFFGAEFTKVYADACGSRILPSPHAEAISQEAQRRQGAEPQVAPSPVARPLPAASVSGESREKRLSLEHALSVVVGALGMIWFLRRGRNKTLRPSN
jgi:membrane protein